MPTPLPEQSYLNACFRYEPATGLLHWRERPVGHFKTERDARAWNGLAAAV